MEPREYDAMRWAEDHHWWYRGLRMVLSLFLDQCNLRNHELALDIGCGTGGTLRNMDLAEHAIGFDASPLALGYCHRDGLRLLVRGSANLLPFRSGALNVVTSLDVLCHRSVRPLQVVREVHRVLRSGGAFFLNLPSYNILQAHHDKYVGTVHRFTHGEVARLFHRAGLQAAWITYWNTVLFPIEFAYRVLDKCLLPGRARSEVTIGHSILDRFFLAIMRLEARLLRRTRLPIGLSIFSVARKAQ